MTCDAGVLDCGGKKVPYIEPPSKQHWKYVRMASRHRTHPWEKYNTQCLQKCKAHYEQLHLNSCRTNVTLTVCRKLSKRSVLDIYNPLIRLIMGALNNVKQLTAGSETTTTDM